MQNFWEIEIEENSRFNFQKKNTFFQKKNEILETPCITKFASNSYNSNNFVKIIGN